MPVQSGSSSVLERMRRGYSREAYLRLIEGTRRVIPSIRLSTDVITGKTRTCHNVLVFQCTYSIYYDVQ